MKTYISILLFFITAMLTSCEKQLEEVLYTDVTSNNFYKTEKDAFAAVVGMYKSVQPNQWMFYNGYYTVMADMTTPMGYATPGGNLKSMVDFSWNGTNQYITNPWNYMWRMVFEANTILEKVPQIKMDENVKADYLAQAKFVRSWAYMELTDMWGEVPLVLRTDVSAVPQPYRNTMAVIDAQILKDLSEAALVLPAQRPANRLAWPTQQAAWAFIHKIYLRNHQWNKAEEYARKIVTAGHNKLFGMEDGVTVTAPYRDLWLVKNKNHSEFIYAVKNTSEGVNSETSSYFAYHNRPADMDDAGGYAYYGVSLYHWWSFADNDPRKWLMIWKYTATDGTEYRAPLSNTDHPQDTSEMPHVYSLKIYLEDMVTGSDECNQPVIRYGELLLYLAECINEQRGGDNEALTLVNMVRKRAGAPVYTGSFSQSELRELIHKEIGWELVFEGKYRQTLNRWGKYVSECNKYIDWRIARGATGLSHMTESMKYFPIPDREIRINPNLGKVPVTEVQFPAIVL